MTRLSSAGIIGAALLAVIGTTACGGSDTPPAGSGAGGHGGRNQAGSSAAGAGRGGRGAETGGEGGAADSSGGGRSNVAGSHAGGATGGTHEAGGTSAQGGAAIGGSNTGGTTGGSATGGTTTTGGSGGWAGLGGEAGTENGGEAGDGGGESLGPCVKVALAGDDAAALASNGMTPFATLTAAVDFAASHPDVAARVCVAEGEYAQPFVITPGVSIYGGYDAGTWQRNGTATTFDIVAAATVTSTSTQATTIDGLTLDAGGDTGAFSISGAKGIVLSNLVVSGSGQQDVQGVIDVVDGADVTIAGLELTATLSSASFDEAQASDHAAIRVRNARATIERSTLDVTGLTANSLPGTTAAFHAVFFEDAPGSLLKDSDVSMHSAQTMSGGVDALRALGDLTSIVVSGSTLRATHSNDGTSTGASSGLLAAVNLDGCAAGAPLIANNAEISATTSVTTPLVAFYATGECFEHSTCPTTPECAPSLQNNGLIAARGPGAFGSVAVACQAGAQCSLVGNAAVQTTASGEMAGTAVECTWCGEIAQNVITGCSEGCASGVGIDLMAGPASVIRDNRVSGGCAGSTWGLVVRAGAPRVENNVIRGYGGDFCGYLENIDGTAWAVDTIGTGTFDSNFLAGGSAISPCGAVHVQAGAPGGAFRNNIIRSGTCAFPNPISIDSPGPSPPLRLEYNDLVAAPSLTIAGAVSVHDFSADPRFVDDPSDLRLASDSPCIDTGTSFDAPAQDLAGNPRDARPDVGPYEYQGSALPDPCAGMACGGQGSCDWFGDHAACVCRDATGAAPVNPGSECGAPICGTTNGNCDPLTQCVDLAAGRACTACPAGYTGSGESGCVQPDLCVPSPCGHGSCSTVAGAARCTCPPGYLGPTCSDAVGTPSAGAEHACSVGSPVHCWGNNDHGQATPPALPMLAIAAGDAFTCGIQGFGNAFSGPIVCWGDNSIGQTSPPNGDFVLIAAGRRHACARGSDGSVVCWGDGSDGQTNAPFGSYIGLSAGGRTSCATRQSDGGIQCWGSDDGGILSQMPPGPFAGLALGDRHGCASLASGSSLVCWGDDTFGQTDHPTFVGGYHLQARGNHTCIQSSDDKITCWGENTQGESSPPSGEFRYGIAIGDHFGCAGAVDHIACWGANTQGQQLAPGGVVLSVSLSHGHGCSLSADGTASCWGGNDSGEATSPAGTFTQVAAGGDFTCARRVDGTLGCWGANTAGQATPPGGAFSALVAGRAHACALHTDGSATCWGDDTFGQASPPSGSWVALAAGENHSCGLRPEGAIECWGANTSGQSSPPAATFSALSAALNHTCGVLTSGGISCFGAPDTGATPPASGTFKVVAAGPAHDCALDTAGELTCWGQNGHGERDAPSDTFSAVTTGNAGQTCAIRSDGTLACWGSIVR